MKKLQLLLNNIHNEIRLNEKLLITLNEQNKSDAINVVIKSTLKKIAALQIEKTTTVKQIDAKKEIEAIKRAKQTARIFGGDN